ncbi:MAG: Ldh family oxidoreductase [Gemmataceae bacterium]|nr:Ldh family oxidoreductase [Gemmataceae bacterium]
MPVFQQGELLDFTRRIFEKSGCPSSEARRVAQSLVEANLSGHDSHGVIRVVQYVKAIETGVMKPGQELKIIQEKPSLICADGGWNLGQVQAHRLLELLIPKASQTGVAAGTLFQCGHIGRLGEYAEAAGLHGMALLATVNNHGFGRAVAPPGGKAGRIATNPICLSAPTEQDPVVLDIGTSVCAEGKVRVSYNKKAKAPDGWLLDSEGKPTNDPGVLYHEPKGTIQPLGGAQSYKGFGLGLLLDMLVGGLSGGPCSNPAVEPRSANAVLFVLFCPAQFAGMEHFLNETTGLSRSVRDCPKAEGFTGPIVLPGDLERHERAKRSVEGINLDDGTWGQIQELATRKGVDFPTKASPK